jgi:hypothetical protein
MGPLKTVIVALFLLITGTVFPISQKMQTFREKLTTLIIPDSQANLPELLVCAALNPYPPLKPAGPLDFMVPYQRNPTNTVTSFAALLKFLK